ncbi:Bacteriophage abortive infection AbiH [Salegentibacter holothuriorum]|uniref:Bacteriophage abortive infection AbiH n=1 Tax=Salegentibacter holothuriorum TaxID=241145 RepID=A0A1T5D9U6_9FLAO|nr:AbiH family protein [Salegentibacter holothuriorum]SKB68484.1 Bacteriophage abortive infection AbiH [Salegentibacter holothuriorum]
MRILHLIGNGFDLNLKMKTSYKEFYQYYKSVKSDDKEIKLLKEHIEEYYKNWSDLELALGEYTEKLENLNQFDNVFDDIGDHLAAYLQEEENKFDSSKIDKDKFYNHLAFPENNLPLADRNKILAYKSKFKRSHWGIDLVTFNYTRILDKIIVEKQQQLVLKTQQNIQTTITLRGVDHIHGFTDDRMILGVNDLSQIKNKSFHSNQNVLEAIVKEKCNKASRHTLDELLKRKINVSDLICIFGSSIGDTDNIWWELIGERLKKNIPLIIFTKGEEIPARRKYKSNRVERDIKTYFLNKTKLSQKEKDAIMPNIYVGLNSGMFNDIRN